MNEDQAANAVLALVTMAMLFSALGACVAALDLIQIGGVLWTAMAVVFVFSAGLTAVAGLLAGREVNWS